MPGDTRTEETSSFIVDQIFADPDSTKDIGVITVREVGGADQTDYANFRVSGVSVAEIGESIIGTLAGQSSSLGVLVFSSGMGDFAKKRSEKIRISDLPSSLLLTAILSEITGDFSASKRKEDF